MNAPSLTTYSEGREIPQGMELVQYDLDEQSLVGTFVYEKRDGIALHVHTVKLDERMPPRSEPYERADWCARVLSQRPLDEIMRELPASTRTLFELRFSEA